MGRDIENRQSTFDDEIEGRKVTLDTFLLNAKYLKEFEQKHKS
jgi:chromosome segregation ATPase